LLISKVLNAAIVTSVIAQTSSCVSFLITIFGFMVSYSPFLQANGLEPSCPAEAGSSYLLYHTLAGRATSK